MDRVVGIDFGTSTSLVGEGILGQRVSLSPIGATTVEMPSTVGVDGDRLLVGEDAEGLPLAQVARSVKRAITGGESSVSLVGAPGRRVDADRAITEVLRTIGDRARAAGLSLTEDAVRLSCPASWTGTQRDRLLRLARAAGLPAADHTLIDEPVAAGIAWTITRTEDYGEDVVGKVLVVDIGGGTLDVAHLEVNAYPGKDPDITVLAAVGQDRAGDALDARVAQDLLDRYVAIGALDAGAQDPSVGAAARKAATEAKIALSHNDATIVRLEGMRTTFPTVVYRRADLDHAFEPQWRKAEQSVWGCLRASTLTNEHNGGTSAADRLGPESLAKDVDHVVLAGGMSRIPLIAARLRRMFPNAAVHANYGMDLVHVVANGLSETAAYGRISFHRPAYDFILHVGDGSAGIIMYEAYSPLYTPAEALTRSQVYHECTVNDRSKIPGYGLGELRIATPKGTPVNIRFDGKLMKGIPVQFGHGGIRLRIWPNGDIFFEDGMRRTWHMRVSNWPIIRSGMSQLIEMERLPQRDVGYDRELGHQHNNRYG